MTDDPHPPRWDDLGAARRTVRVAELHLLAAMTADVWGHAQSAPQEEIFTAASRRAEAEVVRIRNVVNTRRRFSKQ
jgi:hypothetical protein